MKVYGGKFIYGAGVVNQELPSFVKNDIRRNPLKYFYHNNQLVADISYVSEPTYFYLKLIEATKFHVRRDAIESAYALGILIEEFNKYLSNKQLDGKHKSIDLQDFFTKRDTYIELTKIDSNEYLTNLSVLIKTTKNKMTNYLLDLGNSNIVMFPPSELANTC